MMNVFTIWKQIRSTLFKIDVIIIFLIVVLYCATRIIKLDAWPIFSDEGIYIRWAKVAWHDASWRFISVTDGRQPLQTWMTIPMLKLFWPRALFAGRMFSVTTGFAALTGMGGLLYYLWGKKSAYLGVLLYICMPYFLFYDRMALVDSAVNAGFVWMIFLSILLANTQRLDVAYTLGFAGGLALLAKSSSRLFLAVTAFAPLLFYSKPSTRFIQKTINYWAALALSVAISLLFYNVQRLSPFFHYVTMKNLTFVMSFPEFITNPLAFFPHNIVIIPQYIAWESGWAILPVSIGGYILMLRRDVRLAVYFLLFSIIPLGVIAFFAKVIFPRYLLFNATILTIGAVYFFHTQWKKILTIPLLLFLLVSMAVLDYPLLFKPENASFPEVDRGQYIEGVTAVWGAENLMNQVRSTSIANGKKSLILAEGNFGLVADVLDVYLHTDDPIEIRGLWPLNKEHLEESQKDLADKNVFIVFSHREEFPQDWPMTLVTRYAKPHSPHALYLFKLTPSTVRAMEMQ